ncbi:hypothetical protein CBS101457_006059 [Exobasidium rhododendri]|nr:hypothetical protein CBS101457_006059 [Exobasidium rhododendri]
MAKQRPSPAPTAAPLYGRNHGDVKIRLRGEDIKERLEQGGGLVTGDDFVLGPFEARNEGDVEALRREMGLSRDSTSGVDAALNAKAWLSRQRQQRAGIVKKRDFGKRQTTAEQDCFVGNDQLSCYPTSGLQVDQGTWDRFIWNTNYPDFTNNGGYVDVYLFHQDNDLIVTSWTSQPNAQGRVSFIPGDSWWQGRSRADNFNGTSIAWPFYFVITHAGQGLSGSTDRQSTWYAIQTALPEAVALSRSSASASASAESLASAASVASQSAASLTGTAAASLSSSEALASKSFAASLSSALAASLTAQGFTGTETLQGTATTTLPDGHQVTATATAQANGQLPGWNGGEVSLPDYAIALIAVFGFLALVATSVGLYFLLGAARKRRRGAFESSDLDSRTDSSRPMMADDGQANYSDEPISPTGTMSTNMRERSAVESGASLAAIAESSREDREAGQGSRDVPFTSDEASRMADRFRAMLRNPTFESANDVDGVKRRLTSTSQSSQSSPQATAASELMREELEAQGHDLRQVQERRKPEVHD